MYKKILLAYDGSDQSERAMKHAKKISETFGAKLEVVHVYPYPVFSMGEAFVPVPQLYEKNMNEYTEHIVKEIESQISDINNAKVTMLQGPPAKTIVEYADDIDCDLIVIGSRGLGGFKELVLGSVSHNVVQHAEVPVLVVK